MSDEIQNQETAATETQAAAAQPGATDLNISDLVALKSIVATYLMILLNELSKINES